jgi:branched-chain amino acid transport system ATP-binding protein
MLKVTNLSAGYGEIEVLKGISLEVRQGSVVSLIGSNGAGKTTTMRVISGLIKPSDGTISLEGRDITGMDPHHVAARGLAHSPEGRRVFPTLSVKDNLLLGAYTRYSRQRPRGDINGDLDRAMELFPRLKDRKNQAAGTLSGGEQQMLAIARATMLNPQMLLLDEPSMGLAPILVEEVFSIIARLRDQKVTMLIVEQFAAAALRVSDYGYVLENGRISVEGRAAELYGNDKVRAAYLGGSSH